MRKERISEEEFTRRVIDKELEMAGAPIRFDDIAKENKEKHPTWFSDYQFESEEQYNEWKSYWLEQAKLIKGKSHATSSYFEHAFGWFSLNYGLSIKRKDNE